MRLTVLVFAAILATGAAQAQTARSGQSTGQDPATDSEGRYNLPVSLERIREALERPSLLSLRTVDERPTFRIQILEKQRMDELLATLDFRATRGSPGGLYWDELQRVTWPSVDNPLLQPYAPFSGGEIITLAIENVIGKLGAGKLMNAISNASKNRAQAAARDEVVQAIQDYCAAQPNNGAGIQICSTTAAVR
ncbi:MAG TPA: hypothetical protein VF219_13730 [Vicinamibacterales bacterium]